MRKLYYKCEACKGLGKAVRARSEFDLSYTDDKPRPEHEVGRCYVCRGRGFRLTSAGEQIAQLMSMLQRHSE